MGQANRTLPTSEHFKLDRIAEGVYVAIAIEGGLARCNAGIVDLGDQTLLFDTFMTPQAAQDLRAAAEGLTGRPVTYVINSHAHSDHWLGNQVFARHAPVIATHGTRDMMSEAKEDLEQLQEDPSPLEEEIQANERRLETETDPRWRASLERAVASSRDTLEALPTLDLRLPDQTFDGRLVFHGTQRTAELVESGVGHSPSEAYLLLPAERVVFMGDLGFFGRPPFMGDCNPPAWKAQLEKMEGSEVEVFVPGHGPLGTRADLALQRRYMTVVEELVAQAIQDGRPVKETVQQPLPAPFDAWLVDGMARFEANVTWLYERLSSESTS